MDLLGQLLMDSHQVIGFPPGLGEFLLKELIKGPQVVHTPILSCPHFTQITPELHKMTISVLFCGPLPGQDLVDSS